ncbi:purine catabolism regulator [Enterococcus sp. PF1-24]|uniref:PucR family transcriptional regulator n=1 Tax=unclassified Enterococcus TaxID=2608891 RepID=UPI0024749039|nr:MULTISPECIES: PucR family transcriptional regulator [unclassified Enterococcus]MDH6363521.1 purine catabolism regulator [Enterococcus sp. PFB1-1]MDH6400615.1 purine catabolism regulator [Enterococcus sp. PF1-24]
MLIHDMIQLEIFATCKVLTDNIGMKNEVDSVMVLEATDIEKWGRKNQVILTSYYALSDLNDQDLKDFLQKMANIGSSALIVKMDRLIKIIPDELISLCKAFKIPLIKIEKDISYETIVLAIYRPILNYQSHVLKTYYEVRQSFTKIEKNLPSFDRIMETFQELIKRECQLSIPDKKIHVQLPIQKEKWVVLDALPLKNKEFTKNQYELLTLFSQQAAEIKALKTTFQHPYFNEVTLLVYENGRVFDDIDLMIIENLIDIINEKLQMEYLLKKDRYNRLNNLSNALLTGSNITLEEKSSLLSEMEMDFHEYYQGVAISFKDSLVLEKRKDILQKLKFLAPHMIYHDNPGHLIALYNLADEATKITPLKVQQLFKDFFTEFPELTWNITISQLKEKNQIHEILTECLDAMKFNQTFFVNKCLSIEELGIFRHFIRNNQLTAIKELIPPVLIQLYENEPTLFATLASFLRNDKNYQKTAEELFLHAKTVRYRINKINQRFNNDLEKPLLMLNYQIGIYLLEWERKQKE